MCDADGKMTEIAVGTKPIFTEKSSDERQQGHKLTWPQRISYDVSATAIAKADQLANDDDAM